MFNWTWNSLRAKCIAIGSISTTVAWAGLSLYHIISGAEAPASIYYSVYLGTGALGSGLTYCYVKCCSENPTADIVPPITEMPPVIIEDQEVDRKLEEEPAMTNSITPYFTVRKGAPNPEEMPLQGSGVHQSLVMVSKDKEQDKEPSESIYNSGYHDSALLKSLYTLAAEADLEAGEGVDAEEQPDADPIIKTSINYGTV